MVVYTVKQSQDGCWSIRRMGSALFSDLQLAAAIRLARTIAREHGGDVTLANRDDGGLSVRLELPA